MEDPSEDYWEIQGYSQSYESDGKLRWIWKKGLSLGKKMVVTGVVISSAPFVLPPLMALSAIGFAFSVPAGFVFVTYTCTEKLMNTLLPLPSPTSLLDNRTSSFDMEGNHVYGDDYEKGYGEEEDMEGGDVFMEYKRKGVDNDYGRVPVNKETSMKVNEMIEDEGYMEDVGEYMEDEEEQRLDSNVIPAILEGIIEAEDEIFLMESVKYEVPKDSLHAVVVEAKVGEEDENKIEQVLEELAFVAPKDEKEENWRKEDTTGVDKEEQRRETTELLEKIRDEGKNDQKKQEIASKETRKKKSVKNATLDKGNRDLFVIPEEVKPAGDTMGDINEKVGEKSTKEDENGHVQEERKTEVEKELVVHVNTYGDRTATDVRLGISSNGKTGTLVLSDADAREMADESGFDLFDHRTEAPDQLVQSVNKRPQGRGLSSKDAPETNVEYHEESIESKMPMSKHAKTTLDRESEEVSRDEKIWEQIHAMRVIVGYKDEAHSSFVEELKALYVFTGVEPPASFKHPSDLIDIDEELRFLMSIIGVK